MRFCTTRTSFFLAFILLFISCKEKYDPPYQSPDTGYLVVEGVINSSGVTNVILSRTAKISESTTRFETGADCRIQGEDGREFVVRSVGQGRYRSDSLILPATTRYRLRIGTASGKEYFSQFEAIKPTPVIDSVSWTRSAKGVQLNLHAHDDLNKTRYYKWDYDETWEFRSLYTSSVQYNITSTSPFRVSLKPRDSIRGGFDPKLFYCWKSESSTRIVIGSTAKLEKDIVDEPMVSIENASWKLSVLYSFYVRQYALTKEGYEFFERMKKNTEAVGSIFDPQPSQLIGNLYNAADPNEPVIGYVSVSPIVEKRIFIRNTDVPTWGYYQSGCFMVDTVSVVDAYFSGLQPLDAGPPPNFAPAICVDCTLRGSNVRPSFWP